MIVPTGPCLFRPCWTVLRPPFFSPFPPGPELADYYGDAGDFPARRFLGLAAPEDPESVGDAGLNQGPLRATTRGHPSQLPIDGQQQFRRRAVGAAPSTAPGQGLLVRRPLHRVRGGPWSAVIVVSMVTTEDVVVARRQERDQEREISILTLEYKAPLDPAPAVSRLAADWSVGVVLARHLDGSLGGAVPVPGCGDHALRHQAFRRSGVVGALRPAHPGPGCRQLGGDV